MRTSTLGLLAAASLGAALAIMVPACTVAELECRGSEPYIGDSPFSCVLCFELTEADECSSDYVAGRYCCGNDCVTCTPEPSE